MRRCSRARSAPAATAARRAAGGAARVAPAAQRRQRAPQLLPIGMADPFAPPKGDAGQAAAKPVTRRSSQKKRAGGGRRAAERRQRRARLDAGALGAGARAGDGRRAATMRSSSARSCSRATSSATPASSTRARSSTRCAARRSGPSSSELRGALPRGLRRGARQGLLLRRAHAQRQPSRSSRPARGGAAGAAAGGLPLRSRRPSASAASPTPTGTRSRSTARPTARRCCSWSAPQAAPRERRRLVRRPARRARSISATLETVGPFANKGRYDQVGLGTNSRRAADVHVRGDAAPATAYTHRHRADGAGQLEGDGVDPRRRRDPRVAQPGGALRRQGGAGREDRRTARPVPRSTAWRTPVMRGAAARAESLDWSPGKTRLTYAGKLDACKISRRAPRRRRTSSTCRTRQEGAARIAAAVSPFETLWLDDDRLVYEGGVGKDGKLHLYTFRRTPTARCRRAGAGLYGCRRSLRAGRAARRRLGEEPNGSAARTRPANRRARADGNDASGPAAPDRTGRSSRVGRRTNQAQPASSPTSAPRPSARRGWRA